MAILDEGRYLVVGAVLGATAAILSRGVPRSLVEVARPLAKAAVRIGLTGAERALELYGRLGETVEDLAAEVLAERVAEAAEPAIELAEEAAPAPPAVAVLAPVEAAAAAGVPSSVGTGTTEPAPAARRPARRRRTGQ